MADESTFDYLYVVEWDDSVHRPPYTVIHRIKLNPSVGREDFEKFIVDDGFLQVGKIKARSG